MDGRHGRRFSEDSAATSCFSAGSGVSKLASNSRLVVVMRHPMFGTMRIIFFSRAGSKREPGPIRKAGRCSGDGGGGRDGVSGDAAWRAGRLKKEGANCLEGVGRWYNGRKGDAGGAAFEEVRTCGVE